MWGVFSVWLIIWALVIIGVIVYLKKKNVKRDISKFSIMLGLVMAVSLGVILFVAMKMQMATILK